MFKPTKTYVEILNKLYKNLVFLFKSSLQRLLIFEINEKVYAREIPQICGETRPLYSELEKLFIGNPEISLKSNFNPFSWKRY